jgi:methylated-DNA-[protein]-cysteine S-methyltransferase
MTTDRPTLPPADPDAAAAAATRFAERFGARAEVGYAVLDSPVGRLVVAGTRRGLARVAYADFHGGVDAVLDELAAALSPRILEDRARMAGIARELEEYFAGRRTAFDVRLDWGLTKGFGQRILQATARIPFGATSTYRGVAAGAGNERAVRAAGNALGANPLPIVVPCHRVLRTGGSLGGYTGGVDRKLRLLALEGVLLDAG